MSDFQTRFNNSNNYWKPQSPSLIEQNEVICNGFLFYQQNSTFFILTSQKLIKFINCLDVSYVYLSYFTIKYLSTTSIHLQKEELEIILESDHSTITYWYQNLKNKCVQINFFAHYQLSKQIGKGQFATVYEAINILTQSKYAVKVIRRNQRLEEDDIHQEIAIMRTIQNPFVLKIIEVFTDNNNYYIVTELLENTLSKLPKLTEYECCQIIIQILLGLKCIHNKNIFHRDLKPENIFFKQTNKYEITLGDFGLADYIKQDQNYKFTKCGTPGFVAPEILRNNQYDLKVDIYSIGIVLFYLLTQNSPFAGRNQQEIIQKNLKSNVNFDLLNVTSACQELLQDLLQPNPQNRPTANEALHYQWFYQTLGSEVYQSILIQHNETQLLEQYLQITNTTRSVISSSQTIYLRQEQEIQQEIEEKQISQIYLLKQTLIQQFAKMIQ